MEDIVITPDSKHLISIFANDGFNHPFRFQPKLCIVVSFNEYRTFCKDMINVGLPFLSFDTNMYLDALQRSSNKLVRLYYLDLSKAILDEVLKAIGNGRDATKILHDFGNFEENNVLDITNISDELDKLPEQYSSRSFDYLIRQANNNIDLSRVSDHNLQLLKYGLYLYSISWNRDIEKLKLVGGIMTNG